jgi:hypothetical protein
MQKINGCAGRDARPARVVVVFFAAHAERRAMLGAPNFTIAVRETPASRQLLISPESKKRASQHCEARSVVLF